MAEETVKRERQGGKERVAELDSNLKCVDFFPFLTLIRADSLRRAFKGSSSWPRRGITSSQTFWKATRPRRHDNGSSLFIWCITLVIVPLWICITCHGTLIFNANTRLHGNLFHCRKQVEVFYINAERALKKPVTTIYINMQGAVLGRSAHSAACRGIPLS